MGRTTRSVPPAALTRGMSEGSSDLSAATDTEKPSSCDSGDTVGFFIAGRKARMPSSAEGAQLNEMSTRLRASSTLRSKMANSSMRARLAGSAQAALLANRRVVDVSSVSKISRLFALSVAPVAALSTMTSASSGGSDSVAP